MKAARKKLKLTGESLKTASITRDLLLLIDDLFDLQQALNKTSYPYLNPLSYMSFLPNWTRQCKLFFYSLPIFHKTWSNLLCKYTNILFLGLDLNHNLM